MPPLLPSLSGHVPLLRVWEVISVSLPCVPLQPCTLLLSQPSGGTQSPGSQYCNSALTASLPIQVLRGGDPAESGDLSADVDGEGGCAHQGGPAWAPNVSEAALSLPICVLRVSVPGRRIPDCQRMDGWMDIWG